MASSKKPRHGELAAQLETLLRQSVQPGQRLLLGFSGGLDSCVLLHLLSRLRDTNDFELSALHVNHGISPNAPHWQQFCAQVCAEYQVAFTAVTVVVPRDSGLGIEAAARAARYAVLLAQPVDMVVLAHHQDDQAETLLLQLLRGAGVKGLASMPALTATQAAEPSLLRPLLATPRAMLEAYAQQHQLRWIEDESNLDLAYDRNFLRHHVFPELERRFPASRITLARTAAHMAEAAQLLDEVAEEDAAQLVREGKLDVAGLRRLTLPRAKNLLRYWLSLHTEAAPNARRLQEIYRQVLGAGSDSNLSVAVDGGTVHRYRDEAWFVPHVGEIPFAALRWQGEGVLQLPHGRLTFQQNMSAGLSLARVHARELWVRERNGGERFRPDCRRPTRTLRHLFQEAGLPPWQRQMLPMLYLGETLVLVPGIGVACGYQALPGEEGLEVTWQPA